MFSGTFGGALGPVMAGYVFDVTGGYAGAIWICTVISVLGFVLISLLKPVAAAGNEDAH
jgi:nitrate/nitrite transporter NarK